MRPFLSRRIVQSPLRVLRAHTRSLRTLPSPLPLFVATWNPTEHSRIQVPKSSQNADVSHDVVGQDARKLERQHLRDTQGVRAIRNLSWDAEQSDYIKQLNRWLFLADAGKEEIQGGGDGEGQGEREDKRADISFQLWEAYSLAKEKVPNLISEIPDRGWDLLWASSRPALWAWTQEKSKELYEDLRRVGKSNTVGMRIAYLERIFMHGGDKEALRIWEEDHAGFGPGSRHGYKPEHLEMGAKLYALAGNADRARQIMEELFEQYPTWDPSVMMHVFRVHTDTDSEQHVAEAWKIYLRMSQLMMKSSTLTLEHYDSWFVGFLEARHVHYAKLVFRDIIKGRFFATSNSGNSVHETLKRFHLLTRLGSDIEKMTILCLQAITTLPPAYHLHVFKYWMEAAVKFSAWRATAQIMDMVFNRGYRPSTTHFNLFLRGLLRTKEPPQITKAENIGWRMIEETRVALSEEMCKRNAIAETFPEHSSVKEPVLDSETARKVSQADVTTFALIMRHHADQGQWEYVEYLSRRLRETNTEPNATILNVLMNNACRKQKFSEAWRLYKDLTDPRDGVQGVFPDGACMRCIWQTLRLALGNEATRDDPDLPTPRRLLAETVHWVSLHRSRHDTEQFRTGIAATEKTALTNLVMHCFSYTQDLAGSLVALHVMRQHLHIFPTDNVAEILQRQAAWIDMHGEIEAVRSQYNLSKTHEQNLAKLARVYDILLAKKLEKLGYTGDQEQYAHMSDDEIGDLGLNLLSEFIRVIMKRSHDPEAVEAMIQGAKEEAGVPDMSTGDMNAFEVA